VHAYINIYICTLIFPFIYTWTITYIHAYIHAHVYTYIITFMQTYIHTYIYTHTHTYIHTFSMVKFDTGTNFPAVSWNCLLALAMMNIKHLWNGIEVPTQSHPNAASLTLSAWNIQKRYLRAFKRCCFTFTVPPAVQKFIIAGYWLIKIFHYYRISWSNVDS